MFSSSEHKGNGIICTIEKITKGYNYMYCNIGMTWAPEGRRRRGRQKTTVRRTVEKERNEVDWKSQTEVRKAVAEREEWRRPVEALCGSPSHIRDR